MIGKIIYHWIVPDDYQKFTGYYNIPEEYRIIKNEKASAGIVIEAKYYGKWSKNPWNNRVLIKHLLDIIQIFKKKRDYDGHCCRPFDSHIHWTAEDEIEKILKEFTE